MEMDKIELERQYNDLLHFIEFSLNELPVSVTYGTNDANKSQCNDLMQDLDRLEGLSEKMGVDNSQFLQSCRWHYIQYPEYLRNKDQFESYEAYIIKNNGPVRVKAKQ